MTEFATVKRADYLRAERDELEKINRNFSDTLRTTVETLEIIVAERNRLREVNAELLEALRESILCMEAASEVIFERGGVQRTLGDPLDKHLARCRAAIAKATAA